MNRGNAILIALATAALVLGAARVGANSGHVMYVDSNTGESFPQETRSGYIATADGGVVAVLGSPAPTATGQTLCTTTAGYSATAEWGACTPDVVGGDVWINTEGQENTCVLDWYPPTDPNQVETVTISSGSSKATGSFFATRLESCTGGPYSANWLAGTLKAKLFVKVSAASATIHVDYGRCAYPCTTPTLLASNVTVGTVSSTSLVEIDASASVSALAGSVNDEVYLVVWATTTSASAIVVTLADNAFHESRINTPLVQAADLSGYQLTSQLGQANGYAPLDPNAVVPAANMGTGVPYQGRILTACGGTGGVDTSTTCSAAAWVNPPPVLAVDTVAPTPITPRTDTSTGTDTYPSPALHSHRFGVNAAQVDDLPTMQSAGSTSVATATNTNPASVIVMGHPPIGSINGLQSALDGKQPTVSGSQGMEWIFSSSTDTSVGTTTTTNVIPGYGYGRLLAYVVLTTTGTATSTSLVYTPANGTTREEIEYLGGGGGSGYCPSPGSYYMVTGGGAAGEDAFLHLNQGSQIAAWNYYCGKAGPAGVNTSTTTTGGDTVVKIGATIYTAKGGGGSSYAAATTLLEAGGLGVAHSTGGTPTWSFAGQSGLPGIAWSSTEALSGAGAGSRYGSGGAAQIALATGIYLTGTAAAGFAAGAGGCVTTNNGGFTANGAAGTPGVIIVRDYL